MDSYLADDEVCRLLDVSKGVGIVVEVGGKQAVLLYSTCVQPHMRCMIPGVPINEWCVSMITNMVHVHCGCDTSMFSEFETHGVFIYKTKPANFVEWVEAHRVGTVSCYNYWESARM